VEGDARACVARFCSARVGAELGSDWATTWASGRRRRQERERRRDLWWALGGCAGPLLAFGRPVCLLVSARVRGSVDRARR